ncbi:hypothetical protein L1987_70911 [Smallanthus sonchifolius]|uniref:Uncharacterized protein n=1 Tax=Smallanthus sonchifolius TaxID=185202 RepID=A0ACB9AQ73_9ASTR|nr:hypothetical protein L1987_70911 [Smallanthus sonchifolius]
MPAVVSNPRVDILACSRMGDSSTMAIATISQVSFTAKRVATSMIPVSPDVELGNGTNLGLCSDSTLTLVLSSYVSSCVSFPEDYPLLSYLTCSTSMVSTPLGIDELVSSSLVTSLMPVVSSLKLLEFPSVSWPSSSIADQFCISIANDFIMEASLYPSKVVSPQAHGLSYSEECLLEQQDAKKTLALKDAHSEIARLSKELKDATNKLAGVEKYIDRKSYDKQTIEAVIKSYNEECFKVFDPMDMFTFDTYDLNMLYAHPIRIGAGNTTRDEGTLYMRVLRRALKMRAEQMAPKNKLRDN